MEIRDELIEPYHIKLEENQYVVQEEGKGYGAQKGQTVSKPITYHTTLGSALKKIIKLKMLKKHENQTLSLMGYISQYNVAVQELQQLIDE